MSASLLPPLSRSNNHGAIRFRSIVWLNVLDPPSPVLSRCIVRFPDFSATTLNASRSSALSSPGFGTRPVALIREARNFVSKSTWPVRSWPLFQLNTGTMKFTSYEAQAIEPLVSNSPFLAWMYQILSVRAFFEFSRCS